MMLLAENMRKRRLVKAMKIVTDDTKGSGRWTARLPVFCGIFCVVSATERHIKFGQSVEVLFFAESL